VHVDGKEPCRPIERLPFGNEGLPAIDPGGIQWVNQARVEPQGRTSEDLICRGGSARVRGAQAQNTWVVEICRADVAARLAAVGVVDWVDGSEGIRGGGIDRSDCPGEGGKSKVSGNNYVTVLVSLKI
jgi:hypothetical protein